MILARRERNDGSSEPAKSRARDSRGRPRRAGRTRPTRRSSARTSDQRLAVVHPASPSRTSRRYTANVSRESATTEAPRTTTRSSAAAGSSDARLFISSAAALSSAENGRRIDRSPCVETRPFMKAVTGFRRPWARSRRTAVDDVSCAAHRQ
ncbi:hypothetical protein AB1Y20_004579 [Prymnesium parvum]|uniref:Uncharacterized protein n=1 Tax=Prymnesium parvum TaxID=97485 RepID=A0AB34IZJ5_PRYPA